VRQGGLDANSCGFFAIVHALRQGDVNLHHLSQMRPSSPIIRVIVTRVTFRPGAFSEHTRLGKMATGLCGDAFAFSEQELGIEE
jgi:hypothetical protein